jgi:hypothetical protein
VNATSTNLGITTNLIFSSTSPLITLSGTDNATTTFQIKDSSGNNLFELRDYATAVQSIASASAFISHLSYIGQEFNSDTVSPIATTTSTSTNSFVGDDALWNFRTSNANGTYSISGSVNGLARIQTTSATSIGTLVSLGRATSTGTAQNTIVLKANLPVIQTKFIPVETGGTLSTTQDYFIGLMDATTTFTANDTAPANGIYLWTNNSAPADGGTYTWQGVVRSGQANVGTVSCSGTYTFGRAITARIQVESTTVVRFLIDFDASNGINWTDCGTVSGANPTAALAPQFYTIHTVNATRRFDIDYIRVWQDDSLTTPESTPVTQESVPLEDSSSTAFAPSVNDQAYSGYIFSSLMEHVEEIASRTDISQIFADRLNATIELIAPKILTNRLATNNISSATGSDITTNLTENTSFIITSTSTQDAIVLHANGNADLKGSLSANALAIVSNVFAGGNITAAQSLTVGQDASVHGSLAVVNEGTNTPMVMLISKVLYLRMP